MSIVPPTVVKATAGHDLEQFVVSKGGNSVCVLGTCFHAVAWSNMLGDFLLYKLLVHPKYKKVLCLNFDRRSSEFKDLVDKASSMTDEDCPDRLLVLNDDELLSHSPDDTKGNVVDHMISTIKSSISSVKANDSYALVLYSLSETILTLGVKQTFDFIKRLSKLAKDQRKSNILSTLIFVVHESMHSSELLSKIQSLCGVVAKIIPNNGTLSSEVAAEVQSIRKSQATGKVVESIEMFSYDGYLLKAIPVATSANPNTSTSSSVPTASDATSVISMTSMLVDPMNKPKESSVETSSSKANVETARNARLITFDSTDPEFDEDSDPDADLDL